MSNIIKTIDDFFREKLGNYRETPPPEAWGEIEAKLDGLKPPATGTPYRWLTHFAIVSVILILGFSVGKKIIGDSKTDTGDLALNQTSKSTATPVVVKQGNTTATNAGSQTVPQLEQKADNAPAVANNAKHTDARNDGMTGNNDNNNNNKIPAAFSNRANNKTGSSKTAGSKPNKQIAANHSSLKNSPSATSNKNNYQGNLSKPSSEETTEDNNNNIVVAASPNTTLSVVDKSDKQANTANKAPVNKPSASIAAKNSNTRTKPSFPRFEAGVKVGYEGGFNSDAANKLAVAPYVQYNLCPKFSVMLQPGVLVANVKSRTIGTPETYYRANPEDLHITQDPTVTVSKIVGGTTMTYYATTYHYTQTHDSVVKSNRIGGTSAEFELPILLKYNICKHFSVYGGVDLVCNKLTKITEQTYSKNGIVRSMDINDTTVTSPVKPSAGFNYSGSPIDNYKGPITATQNGYQFNVGYMLGLSYAVNKTWLVDVLVKQSSASSDVKGGYNINAPLSATYFRFSLGYKFIR